MKQVKNTTQNMWKKGIWVIAGIVGVSLKGLIQWINDPNLIWEMKGNLMHIFFSLPIMLFFFIYYQVMEKAFFEKVLFRVCDKKYPTKQKQINRALLICKWFGDVLYYFSSSIIAYQLLKQQSFFPQVLKFNSFSKESFICPNLILPLVPKSRESSWQLYLLFQFNYHLFTLLKQIITGGNYGSSKFYQYALHHFMSVALIFYAYMATVWGIAIMVLMIHDFSDAILQGGRCVLENKFRNEKIFNFVIYPIMVITWFFCRLLVFPACCIASIFMLKDMQIPTFGYIMTSVQFGLLIMHIYWMYYILKSAVNFKEKKY